MNIPPVRNKITITSIVPPLWPRTRLDRLPYLVPGTGILDFLFFVSPAIFKKQGYQAIVPGTMYWYRRPPMHTYRMHVQPYISGYTEVLPHGTSRNRDILLSNKTNFTGPPFCFSSHCFGGGVS